MKISTLRKSNKVKFTQDIRGEKTNQKERQLRLSNNSRNNDKINDKGLQKAVWCDAKFIKGRTDKSENLFAKLFFLAHVIKRHQHK